MSSNSPTQLVPTYFGFIESTYDALVLFEACLTGLTTCVVRRPYRQDREHIVKSGNIFIYQENMTEIQRWKDNIAWSCSRCFGKFLIYRQIQRSVGPVRKNEVLEKPKAPNRISRTNDQTNDRAENSLSQVYTKPNSVNGTYAKAGMMDPEVEKALIGSFTGSYDFVDDGLVKKTIKVTVNGIAYRLVSYYTLADAVAREFPVPSRDPKFLYLVPRPALMEILQELFDEVKPFDEVNLPISSMATVEQSSGYPQARSMYVGTSGMSCASVSHDQLPPFYNYMPYKSHPTTSPSIYTPNCFPSGDSFSAQAYMYNISSTTGLDGSRVQIPASADHRGSAFQHDRSQDSGIAMGNGIQDSLDVNTSYYQRPREEQHPQQQDNQHCECCSSTEVAS